VVGLHFIPFAFIFSRSIDFYIAGWVVVWALVGIWLIASQVLPARRPTTDELLLP
jgi:hypothetical protein